MFAVIFEVQPRSEAWDEYLGHAAALRPELLEIDGFVANERFASRNRSGLLVSLSIWRNEKALIRWRTHSLHHLIQGKGRSSVFAGYRLRVGEIVADTEPEMPLQQQRFDTTEVNPAKAVTITEGGADEAGSDPRYGPIEFDLFDSITRPEHKLLVQSWPDISAAEAAVADRVGHHRVVRVIRDYGMHDRAEAPQYFPPVER
jgi:heme-degrading monooxygenase HmoA